MAHRDFAGRSGSKNNKKKAKKSFNRNTLIVLALVAVLGFGLGLYFLKSKTPAPVVTTNVQPEKPQPKSVLPNRPEEVWHYIKELETRTVPVDNNPSSVEKNMRLTEEQRQVLIQMEKEQKAAEEARSATSRPRPVTRSAQTAEPQVDSNFRGVYITPNGKRYHYDPQCGGKNSYRVGINSVGGRTPCKKCVH